jgi:hypothetical protein
MPKSKKIKNQYVDLNEHRYGLFMSDESFDLDIMYGRTWLVSDNVQEVYIHKINIIETKTHSLYGQTKATNKKFFTPVKISAFVKVDPNQQSNYGDEKNGIPRNDTGNITLNIYLKELEEKDLVIDRGDIIQYNMSGEKNRYYEVDNAMNVTDSSENTRGGFRTVIRKVTGVPVKEDMTAFLKETI